MKQQAVKKQEARVKRAIRVRRRVRGTTERPRLSIHKSNRHLFAQIIDDERGCTLAGVGTLSKGFKGSEHGKRCRSAAQAIGKQLAQLAKEKGIERVVLDRGQFKYTGTLVALADAAREGGLQF